MTEWISVKDRLPELIAKVIWYNEHGDVIIGKYTELGWKFSYYSGVPTHGEADARTAGRRIIMLDFGRNEWRTARKSHKCYLCDKEIQKGERYFYADGRADGEFFHTHYHESCEEILRLYFRAHSGDDEWDHCWATDWLEEYCQDNCEQFGQCGRSVFECEKVKKIIRGATNG